MLGRAEPSRDETGQDGEIHTETPYEFAAARMLRNARGKSACKNTRERERGMSGGRGEEREGKVRLRSA